MVFEIEKSTPDYRFDLPITPYDRVGISIDWGDGSVSDILVAASQFVIPIYHLYNKEGCYRIKLYNMTDNQIYRIGNYWGWADSITNFISIGRIYLLNLDGMFSNTNFNGNIGPNWDTTHIRGMSNVFESNSGFDRPFGINWGLDSTITAPVFIAIDNYMENAVRKMTLNKDILEYRHKYSGYTPLLYASKSHNYEMLAILLENGADVNACVKGKNALILALSDSLEQRPHGRINTVKALLGAGISPNHVDDNLATALMYICYNPSSYCALDIITILINSGAELNIQDKKGRTALMIACKYGYDSVKVAYKLVLAGADKEIRDNFGNTALMYACDYRNVPFGTEDYGIIIKKSYESLISFMINHGADTTVKNYNVTEPSLTVL